MRHFQGELSSYDNLAMTYFYLGRVDKSEYYADRVFEGKTEAMFSVIKKISMSYTKRKYKNVKVTAFKTDVGNDMMKGTMNAKNIEAGLKEVFRSAV